jgi:hypothetical protein
MDVKFYEGYGYPGRRVRTAVGKKVHGICIGSTALPLNPTLTITPNHLSFRLP